ITIDFLSWSIKVISVKRFIHNKSIIPYSEYNFRALLTNIEFRFIIKLRFSILFERGVIWHKY
ncbi:hypothetical protein HMPREF3200_00870, partial [Anaerococcus tetradius]